MTATLEPVAPARAEPPPLEQVPCPACGSERRSPFITAQDDYTGKPGTWRFVTCDDCGLRYQHPRVPLERIGAWYDSEYIAHRRKTDWGLLTGFYEWAMSRHDRQKDAIVRRHVRLDASSELLDVGCAVGSFLQLMRTRYGARVTGVDFKDLRGHPLLDGVEFHHGVLCDQPLARERFDLVTMWHFLEHDYEPRRTLERARDVMKRDGRLIVEVPRLDSLSFRIFGARWPGLQAPQHTVLYDFRTLRAMVERAGFEVVAHLPYGAFPAFFYFFAGTAFTLLRGRGLDLSRAIYPYFIGQILASPVLALERQLNFAMQTIVCRKAA